MVGVEENNSKNDNVRFNSMPNFRKVYEIEDKAVAEQIIGKLYRSSRPDFLTQDEITSFRKLGIRSIIDFRSTREYKKANGNKLLDLFYPIHKIKLPQKYTTRHSVEYKPYKIKTSPVNGFNEHHNLDGKHFLINFFNLNYVWAIFSRAPIYFRIYSMLFLIVDLLLNTGYKYFVRLFAKKVLNETGLIGQYKDMIKHSQASICSALKLLSDPDNLPAMLNCAHGKDRTGIVSALVLVCLGRSKQVIAENYGKSEEELTEMKPRMRAEIVEHFHMSESFIIAQSEIMMELLNHIEENYGSLTGYMDYIGFGPDEQHKLRNNLLN